MAQSNWEGMLDVYIYDHLVRKKLHNTANSFMTESKVSPDPVAIDGLLFTWWSMFWDIYNAKTKEKQAEPAVEYGLNVYIYDYLVKKKLHNSAKTFMSEVKVSPDHVAIDTPGGFLFAWWSVFWAFFIARRNEKPFDSAAEAQQGKEKEQMKQHNPRTTETSQPHMDAGTIHHGQMVHGKQGGVSSALQKLQSRTRQTPENKSKANLWASPRQLTVDPSTVYGQGILQSKPGMGTTGLSPGVGAHPLKGWPFTGIDNMRQGSGPQIQKAFLQNQGQFELSPQQQQQQQQQQIMAQVQGQGNMTSSLMYGEGVAITENMQRVNNMPKGPMMYGSDAIGGLASSANQLDDMEPFGDVGALKDDLEPLSFVDDEVVASVFNILNWNPSEYIEPQPNPMNTEISQPHMDPMMALLKSGTTYPGEMVQGNHQGGGVSASLQQLKSRTQQTPLEAGEGESLGICSCKKSKCLKLYCECFAAGFYCSTECSCIDCFNKPIHEATVLATREKIVSRDPLAFAPRVSDSVLETREADASKTPVSARHKRGCNCKKSNCLKKYCECFQFGVGCSINCRCESCKNTFGRGGLPLASVSKKKMNSL